MNINANNIVGTNNKPSNESNDKALQPKNPSLPLTDAERTIAEPGIADMLAQVPPDAKSVETFKAPNIFNSGINLGRDNHVNFGLFSNVTVDGLAEASGTIGAESLSFTGAPFGINDGSSYVNFGSGRSIVGATDENGFPVANSPTDTREEGLNSVNIGAWTLSKQQKLPMWIKTATRKPLVPIMLLWALTPMVQK